MAFWSGIDLDSNERIVYCAKLSLWSRFRNIVLGIVLIPLIVGVLMLLKLAIDYVSISYVVTNKRFIARSGFFSRKIESVDHSRALGIEISQSFLGRMLNYGTVTVRMPLATNGGDFSGICISAPNTFAECYRRATAPRNNTSGVKK